MLAFVNSLRITQAFVFVSTAVVFQIVIFRIVTPSGHVGGGYQSHSYLPLRMILKGIVFSHFSVFDFLFLRRKILGPYKGLTFLTIPVPPVTKTNMGCPGSVSSPPVLCLSDVANQFHTPHSLISRWGQEVPSKCQYLRKRQHGATVRSPCSVL